MNVLQRNFREIGLMLSDITEDCTVNFLILTVQPISQ
jgi:hypothetical protein